MPTASERRQRRLRRFADAQDNTCPMCRLMFPGDLADTEIDHIIPKSRGGPEARWNLRLLHRRCNRLKFAGVTAEAEALAVKHGIEITPLSRRPAYWHLAVVPSKTPEPPEPPTFTGPALPIEWERS